MIRVLVADDHNGMREGLVVILNQQDGIHVVDDVPDGRSAVARLKQSGIDVALIDMMMPDMEGDEVIRAVLAEDGWKPRMVIYSGFVDNGLVRRAMEAGACGYLDKGAGILETVKVIQAVARGEVCLCPRALKVVGEDVVAEAVRANSARALRVSAGQLVEEFLAHELSREDPTWPLDVREVYRSVVWSVPRANVDVPEILRHSAIRGTRILRTYCLHTGHSIKRHQTSLKLRLVDMLLRSGHAQIDAAFHAGYNTASAFLNSRDRHWGDVRPTTMKRQTKTKT